MSTRGTPIVEVEHLTVDFRAPGARWLGRRRRAVTVLDDLSFNMVRGETLGLVGESGCGKSTTGRALLRLNEPRAGASIRFAGRELIGLGRDELRGVRRRLQMIYQDTYSSLNPRMTVREILAEPLEVHRVGSRQEIGQRCLELLGLVGLPSSAANLYPHQFSGGQRQRIGIARALALHPELIIADEPVSALDVSIQAQIINLLKELQSALGLTYLFISHDLAVVRQICDRVMVMFLGRVVEAAPIETLFGNPQHPYTVALLSAVPVPDPVVEARRRRIILEGEVATPEETPGGCRFRPRCWLYQQLGSPRLCTEADPRGATAGAEHRVECHYYDRTAEAAELLGT